MAAARQTIGPFSRQIIARTSQALPELWLTLNRDGHRSDSNEVVTECFEEVRKSPLLQICRDVRDEGGEPLNVEHHATERMLKFLSRREGYGRLPAAFCATGTLIARKIEEIRQMAKVETNDVTRKEYDVAFQ